MGITGLIPFLEKASKKTNVSEFSGGTVAIDSYCWLHRGAFSCADKIIMGQATDAYVKYCMKFVEMLLSNKIKPILVFDGRHLPAKAETEVKRRESRESNRKRAAEFMKMGKVNEGKNLLRRSLDVSHKMALEVIKECQIRNIDCIVAPYEADAQLAYLNLSGIADVVITEDSDLTLFGCKKILFKMDVYGNGLLVEQDRLHLAMGLRPSTFSMDKFIHMCILSGCDYLPSLPGIGLQKACKFIVKNTDQNIYNALTRLATTLNKKTLIVTKEYRDGFMRAMVTFKHQLVYCPLQRKQVRLNPPTTDVTDEQLTHAGTEVDDELAWQLALGNLDPFSCEKLHDFDPDKPRKVNPWNGTVMAQHTSIWSKNFNPTREQSNGKLAASPKKEKQLTLRSISTRGQVVTMKTESLRRDSSTPKKRTREESEVSVDDILQLYSRDEIEKAKAKPEPEPKPNEPTSPLIVRRSNPFKKLNDSTETSPSLLYRTRRRCVGNSRFQSTVIDHTVVKQSRFFADDNDESPKEELKNNNNEEKEESKDEKEKAEEEPMEVVPESMEVNVDSQDYKENMESMAATEAAAVRRKVVIPETEIDVHSQSYKENVESMDVSVVAVDRPNVLIPETEVDDSQDCKENLESMDVSVVAVERPNVLIPETEPSDNDDENDVIPNVQKDNNNSKDSGFKDLSSDKVSVSEKEPLQLVDDNSVVQLNITRSRGESKIEKRNDVSPSRNDDEDVQFSITREIFSEYRSSMFSYESPGKRPRMETSFSSSQKNSRTLQRSLSARNVKTSTKKTTTIQGQQSILKMFGFQKRNSFQH